MDSFSNTERTLLALIKSSLFNIPFDNVQETDWDELYQEAKAQTVTALIAGCVPEEAGSKWKTAYTVNLSKNLRYLHAQSELIEIFRGNNIPLIILKGASAAVYYPAPINRAMGDIDFIVPQNLYKTFLIRLLAHPCCFPPRVTFFHDLVFWSPVISSGRHPHGCAVHSCCLKSFPVRWILIQPTISFSIGNMLRTVLSIL